MDLTGKRFGRLTVIRQDGYHYYPNSKKKTKWLCKCDCGNTISVIGSDLNNGHTQSCGCLRKEITGSKYRTHGDSGKSRLYRIWSAMKSRCNNASMAPYKYYGARGIKICDEWDKSYETFKEWALSHGYSDDLSIDRIDVDGNYTPENCRWATTKEQSVNTRKTRYIDYDNRTLSLKEWSDIFHIPYSCLLYRLDTGWDVERALTTPSRKSLVAGA